MTTSIPLFEALQNRAHQSMGFKGPCFCEKGTGTEEDRSRYIIKNAVEDTTDQPIFYRTRGGAGFNNDANANAWYNMWDESNPQHQENFEKTFDVDQKTLEKNDVLHSLADTMRRRAADIIRRAKAEALNELSRYNLRLCSSENPMSDERLTELYHNKIMDELERRRKNDKTANPADLMASILQETRTAVERPVERNDRTKSAFAGVDAANDLYKELITSGMHELTQDWAESLDEANLNLDAVRAQSDDEYNGAIQQNGNQWDGLDVNDQGQTLYTGGRSSSTTYEDAPTSKYKSTEEVRAKQLAARQVKRDNWFEENNKLAAESALNNSLLAGLLVMAKANPNGTVAASYLKNNPQVIKQLNPFLRKHSWDGDTNTLINDVLPLAASYMNDMAADANADGIHLSNTPRSYVVTGEHGETPAAAIDASRQFDKVTKAIASLDKQSKALTKRIKELRKSGATNKKDINMLDAYIKERKGINKQRSILIDDARHKFPGRLDWGLIDERVEENAASLSELTGLDKKLDGSSTHLSSRYAYDDALERQRVNRAAAESAKPNPAVVKDTNKQIIGKYNSFRSKDIVDGQTFSDFTATKDAPKIMSGTIKKMEKYLSPVATTYTPVDAIIDALNRVSAKQMMEKMRKNAN